MSKYKLTYFSSRARGELCRYLLHAAKVPFEDVYIEDGPTWDEAKKRSPFGQCPFLETDDGKMLAQSMAIARYLARELNLAGKTSWETAVVEQYADLCQEMINTLLRLCYYEPEGEEQKKEGMKKFLEEVTPKYLKIFESVLEKGGGTYMVGDTLTMADLAVLDGFDTAVQNDSHIMDSYPKLSAHRQMLKELPGIKSYVQTRQKEEL